MTRFLLLIAAVGLGLSSPLLTDSGRVQAQVARTDTIRFMAATRGFDYENPISGFREWCYTNYWHQSWSNPSSALDEVAQYQAPPEPRIVVTATRTKRSILQPSVLQTCQVARNRRHASRCGQEAPVERIRTAARLSRSIIMITSHGTTMRKAATGKESSACYIPLPPIVAGPTLSYLPSRSHPPVGTTGRR